MNRHNTIKILTVTLIGSFVTTYAADAFAVTGIGGGTGTTLTCSEQLNLCRADRDAAQNDLAVCNSDLSLAQDQIINLSDTLLDTTTVTVKSLKGKLDSLKLALKKGDTRKARAAAKWLLKNNQSNETSLISAGIELSK